MFNHTTVLLNESVDALNIKPSGIYVDATLGGAGHSSLILSKLDQDGRLICFDQDQIAIDNALKKFDGDDRVTIVKSNFEHLKQELSNLGIDAIDGILFDLGVSSMQIDTDSRGFSYIHDGPLDMRMNPESSLCAADIVNNYSLKELEVVFKKYGQEKFANLYAKAIVAKREDEPFTTTKQLTDLILEVIPKKAFYSSNSHPAIRVFQALRIEVNRELDVFENTLLDCFELINSGGRIAVITFHSLEDRICKYHFKMVSEIDQELKKLPVIPDQLKAKFSKVTNKPILPTADELEANSRARSAKLRILERI